MKSTAQEMAQAFLDLASGWREDCNREAMKLTLEHRNGPSYSGNTAKRIADLEAMARAYGRIAWVAGQTVDTIKTGEPCLDPVVSKGAF